MNTHPDRRAGRHRATAVALAVLTSLAVSYSGLGGSFIYDDRTYVLANDSVVGDASIFSEPTPPTLLDPDGTISSGARLGLYRPLTILTYRLDYLRGNLDAGRFHQTNAALDAVATGAVTWLLTTLAPPVAAAGGGLLFAAHPMHREAVAWIVGRAEILATLLAVLALLAHRRAPDDRASKWTWIGAACYLLASLAKESVLALPGALACADLAARRRGDSTIPWRRWLPYGLAAITIIAARCLVLGRFGPDVTTDYMVGDLSTPERLRLGQSVLWFTASHLLVPVGLSIFYTIDSFLAPWKTLLGALIFVTSVTALVITIRRRDRPIATALGLFLFGMLPFLHLVPIGAVFGDRFAYLPSVGFCGLLAIAAARGGPRRRTVVAAATTALVVAFAAGSIARNAVFACERTLWEDATAKDDEQPIAHYMLARELRDAGLLEYQSDQRRGAIYHYQRALQVDPTSPVAIYAHLALGQDAVSRRHDPALAAEHYRAALEIDPNFGDGWTHLAALAPTGVVSRDEAIAALETALTLPLTDAAREHTERSLTKLREG